MRERVEPRLRRDEPHSQHAHAAPSGDERIRPEPASENDRPASTPNWSDVPFYRRSAFVITTLWILTPLSLLILWTGPVYLQRKGSVVRHSTAGKVTYTALGLAFMGFGIVQVAGQFQSVNRCTEDAILARLMDLNAATPAPNGTLAQLNRTNAYQFKLTQAMSRVQAAFLRNDLKTACAAVDDAEATLRQ